MAVCAVLYLVWWIIFFRPGKAPVQGSLYTFGVACIVGAAVTGVVGCFSAGGALQSLPGCGKVSFLPFVVGAPVAYVVALVVTAAFLHRRVTTELLLIVLWCAFELAVVRGLSVGVLGTGAARALVLVVLALTAASLVCYALFYRLPAMAGFVDGMVPLVSVGTAAITIAVVLRMVLLRVV